ncbi:MAG: hypothetical protein M3362_21155, partial [Acidobacteriota bacterium]|nr:hypothetical protein [Acidobacteriota bacterium]
MRIFASILSLILLSAIANGQTTRQTPQQTGDQEDVIRVSTALVQTDVVVTDKNDQIVPDLKLEDFEVYENGKKQNLKFIEFVSTETGRRTEGSRPALPGIDAEVAKELTARDLKRVIAFVIDDLTVPFQDLVYVRQTLTDFVDNKMQEGDLVAIIRT